MGHYSELYIGALHLSWKYSIPTFATFLFDEADFYLVEEDGHIVRVGYQRSCSQSLDVLNKYGFTFESFVEMLEFFHDDLFHAFRENLSEAIAEHHQYTLTDEEIESTTHHYLESWPKLSRADQLRDFSKFLAKLLAADGQAFPIEQPSIFRLSDGKEYAIDPNEYLRNNVQGELRLIDFEALQTYIVDKTMIFPPWIVMLASLFDWSYFSEYDEIISLMFVRLALDAVPPEADIRLELSDIVENAEHARQVMTELAQSLVGKINLYNRTFRPLLEREETLRATFIRTRAAELLKECRESEDSSLKGRRLEELVELVFTSHHSLQLVDKRVSTGDEEIDLVVKNNVDRPFWLAFGSPLLFVECKNWVRPVGTKEIRDFEGKLRNHGKLVKIGFIVALGGFSAEVQTELRRSGRDEYHLVLLTGDDFDEFVAARSEFFDWLEGKTAKFY